MVAGTNNFEGGTDGTQVTALNSGGASGTAFDSMFGTGLTFKSAAALHGSMGARVVAGQFGAGQVNINGVKAQGKILFRVPATTTADLFVVRADSTTPARIFSVHINGAGKLRVDDISGTGGVWTFTNVLTSNQKYWLQYHIIAGTTSGNGTIKVAYFLDGSTTPVETTYFANGTANLGAGLTIGKIYFGPTGSAGTVDMDIDDAAWDSTLSDIIGFPASAPPTVSTPANQNVSTSAAVTASVTASSSSGTISSYAWSVIYSSTTTPTLTGATTNTVSFTATGTAGHLYILQCVVTDSNSLTTTVTTEVRVPTSGDATILPGTATTSVGSWSSVGGASTPGQALSDSSDTTYLESAAMSATAQTTRYRVAPMAARSALTPTVRLAQDTSGATTAKVRLFEGSTQRQEWTQAITTSFADYPLTVTTPGAITDWGNLYLEVVGTAP